VALLRSSIPHLHRPHLDLSWVNEMICDYDCGLLGLWSDLVASRIDGDDRDFWIGLDVASETSHATAGQQRAVVRSVKRNVSGRLGLLDNQAWTAT
jgi:hypothetical protein